MPSLGRREVLTATSLGFVGLSGCMSVLGGTTPDGEIRPSGDPPVVPSTFDCDDDSFERLDQPFREENLSWGDLSEPSVAIRVSDTDVSLGDTVTVTLANVGRSTIMTGIKSKYSIQLQTENGWLDVRGTTNGETNVYPDAGVQHNPGEGFAWSLHLTDEGLIDSQSSEASMRVCPSLQSGRYRFVYWGVGRDAIGVAFGVE